MSKLYYRLNWTRKPSDPIRKYLVAYIVTTSLNGAHRQIKKAVQKRGYVYHLRTLRRISQATYQKAHSLVQ